MLLVLGFRCFIAVLCVCLCVYVQILPVFDVSYGGLILCADFTNTEGEREREGESEREGVGRERERQGGRAHGACFIFRAAFKLQRHCIDLSQSCAIAITTSDSVNIFALSLRKEKNTGKRWRPSFGPRHLFCRWA